MSTPLPSSSSLNNKRKKTALYYWLSCAFLGILGFFFWLFYFRFIEYTTDAYVEGNQVYITPLHSGFVTAIHTDDTFLVKRGELLVNLDRTDAEIAFNKAQEELAQTVRQVCEMFHQVFAYQAEIEIKKAELIKASEDFDHRNAVLAQGGVSLEDFQHAVAEFRANFYSLKMTEVLYEKALAAVQGKTLRNHPLIRASADRLRASWVYLYRCQIYSPVEGLAAQRTIQVGMWTEAGTPLMSVIPLDQIWVNANYKETQLKKMRIGQRVKITSDLYGRDVIFHGKIIGLPGAAGNAFSLLPPQNLSGNWIKIVQRLPVRVMIDPDDLKRHPLRIGLTMEATVDLRDQEGQVVPTTSAGSPLYKTPIFEKEEQGDKELIDTIILGNTDPKLFGFLDAPIFAKPLPLSSYESP
jgi:membrane fusion protein, multidrug efflux system